MTCIKHEPGLFVYYTYPVTYVCVKCGEKYTQESENMKAQLYTPSELDKIKADMAPKNKPIKI